jgi:pimeloyl-ACP methyl ester carboxylesterase
MADAPFPIESRQGRLQGQWIAPARAAGDEDGDSEAARAGERTPAPIVLLHEGLGSIGQWRSRQIDFPQALADRLRRPVFAYDRLGYGGADALPGPRPVDYLYREAAALPEVLDAVGIDRAVLFGHSDGGTIALLAAADRPDRVAATISMAAHVIVEDVTIAGIAAARAAFDAPESRLRQGLTKYHGDKTAFTFGQWADLWPTPAFRAFDMTDRLPAIACPVLALQGAEDEYGSPEQLRLIEAGIVAGGRGRVETVLLPDCRHAPHFQATSAVLDLTANFLGPGPMR